MNDREKVIKESEEAIDILSKAEEPTFWMDFVRCALENALALLKEQEEQKRKWLQTIADTQLAISPTGYESEDELAKRGWEWNGLQMAWEIIAGEERSEHPRLVRCKDCIHNGKVEKCVLAAIAAEKDWPLFMLDNHGEWFCADGERMDGSADQVSDRVPGRMGHHGDYSEDKR